MHTDTQLSPRIRIPCMWMQRYIRTRRLCTTPQAMSTTRTTLNRINKIRVMFNRPFFTSFIRPTAIHDMNFRMPFTYTVHYVHVMCAWVLVWNPNSIAVSVQRQAQAINDAFSNDTFSITTNMLVHDSTKEQTERERKNRRHEIKVSFGCFRVAFVNGMKDHSKMREKNKEQKGRLKNIRNHQDNRLSLSSEWIIFFVVGCF